MNARRMAALVAALMCSLIVVGVAVAQSSSHYGLPWSLFAGGGGTSQSSHYAISGTLGQGMVGIAASPSYRIGAGFWHPSGPPPVGYRVRLPLMISG